MQPKKFHVELKIKIAIRGLDTLEIEPFSLGGFNSRLHIFKKDVYQAQVKVAHGLGYLFRDQIDVRATLVF